MFTMDGSPSANSRNDNHCNRAFAWVILYFLLEPLKISPSLIYFQFKLIEVFPTEFKADLFQPTWILWENLWCDEIWTKEIFAEHIFTEFAGWVLGA